MNRIMIEPFLGKLVRIVLEPNFVLSGTIDYVDNDSILFTTTQKTAIIHFSKIREVYPL